MNPTCFSAKMFVVTVLLFLAGISACQERRVNEMDNPMNSTTDIAPIIQETGVLYIRSEYFQASGLSVLFPGEFQPLTTIYEWWYDPEEPYRFYHKASEQHPDGLHLARANGSDGTTGHWILSREAGMATDEFTPGRPYPGTDYTFETWLKVFIRGGDRWIDAWRAGDAEELEQVDHPRFGRLVVLRMVDEGVVTTASVRIETPHLVVEEISENNPESHDSTLKLTDWEWLESEQLTPNFWMTPPE